MAAPFDIVGIDHIVLRAADPAFGGIVLQNSVFANEQNFPEALVRSFKNDVGVT